VGKAVGVVVPKDVKISLPFGAGERVGVVVPGNVRIALPFAVGEGPEPEGAGVLSGGVVVVVSSSHGSSPPLVLLSSSSPVPLSSSQFSSSLPVRPPWTPATSKRASASSFLSHERVVPSVLTRGRATHIVPGMQGVSAHFPATHCANCWLMQAVEPARKQVRYMDEGGIIGNPLWHDCIAVRLAN